MRYLLDTNILIAAIKGHPKVRTRLESTPLDGLILSPIVLGELEHGVQKSQQREKNAARLAHLLENLQLIPLSEQSSRLYGHIKAALEQQGQTIGANDYWIAAQALALDAVMVTDNMGEFSRVPGLMVENWLADTE